jgi:NAD(P)-dependent dehydrogenase (short-subunit alcohol dehydrogenase family)
MNTMQTDIAPDDITFMRGVTGATFIVTGAASGLGKATALVAARRGANVVATDLNGESLARMATEAKAGRIATVPGNIADLGLHAELIRIALERFGALDGLYHAAAMIERNYDIKAVQEADWERHAQVNEKATWFLTREVCENMKERNVAGAIVLTASVGAFTGGLGGSWIYASTKGAVLTMVRSFARQYGPSGIRVNSISPGPINTPMLFRDIKRELVEKMLDTMVALRRMGEPEEAARTILFLLSQEASYVSGVTLDVDGGWLCR